MFKDSQIYYDLRIAAISIKKTPILSALIVITLGIGLGAFMTMVTLYVFMNNDPIPSKSNQLYTYSLDNRALNDEHWKKNKHPPPLISYQDALSLLMSDLSSQQAVYYTNRSIYSNVEDKVYPFWDIIRLTTPGFFSLFDVPFLYGGPWSQQQETEQALVIVIPKEMNDKVFGGENSIGEKIKVDDSYLEVVGVTDIFSPIPKYFHFDTFFNNDLEGAYVPFSLATVLKKMGNNHFCLSPPKDNLFKSALTADCNWLHHWVLLPTLDDRDNFLEMLNNYSIDQRRYGRFQTDFNNRIYNVNEWLERWDFLTNKLIKLIIVAFIFLFICLINSHSLLLAKFSSKKGNISIMRALGSSKNRIFRQYLVEISLIGFLSGALGIVLTLIGLSAIVFLFEYFKNIAQLNIELAIMTVVFGITSIIVTGLYPAWKICQLEPAQYLKSQ